MEGFFSAEGIASGEQLHVQNMPKRCLFFSAAKPRVAKVHNVQTEGSNLSVYLTVLWSVSSTKDIYKTTKNFSCTPYNISGRYFDHGLISRGNDTLLFLYQGLGFLINIMKSVLQPWQVTQFLGMEIQ